MKSQAEWEGRGRIIIVPLDGSVEAQVALPVARLVSRITGAAIHILYATEESLTLEEVCRRLKLSRCEETVGLVVHPATGAAGEAIVRRAAAENAMLVVMTTRGKTAYQGRTLRPVPEQVLREAPCPVILVRPETAARVARLKALRRIMLPLNGAPSVMAACCMAVHMAERTGAELDVLCVAALRERATAEPGTFTLPRYIDHEEYEWPDWARECTDRLWASVECHPVGVTTRVIVRHGDPGREILRAAIEQATDLIAMAWRGRFDPPHAAVLRQVLEETPCPVLVLRTAPSERQ